MSLTKTAHLEVTIQTEESRIGECYCSVHCQFFNVIGRDEGNMADCRFYDEYLVPVQSLSPLWDDNYKRTEQCMKDFGINRKSAR